jgi:SsrA-binding protein
MARTKTPPGTQLIASNRRARRNYDILETIEAGLVLRGSEVKSLREARVQLGDAYARIEDGEAWLESMHIGVYEHSQRHSGHEPERRRKLLLHRSEIDRLRQIVEEQHLTLVPLSIYFKNGIAKVELALARGRKTYDKRRVLAERDAAREAQRAMARAGRDD